MQHTAARRNMSGSAVQPGLKLYDNRRASFATQLPTQMHTYTTLLPYSKTATGVLPRVSQTCMLCDKVLNLANRWSIRWILGPSDMQTEQTVVFQPSIRHIKGRGTVFVHGPSVCRMI